MKYIKKFFKFSLFALAIIFFIFFENNYIFTDSLTFSSQGRIDDIKILHISDLHNKKIENVLSSFHKNIVKNKPDIVVITGDIISSNKEKSLSYINYLKSCFDDLPVYYVNGNHEYSDYSFLRKFNNTMKEKGFTCLDGIGKTISVNGQKLYIAGLKDPNAYEETSESLIKKRIEALETKSKIFKILLSHRAEFAPIYNQSNFDLVMCGHAHGGVVGIPFTNRGLYSSGEGFFPKYVEGLHTKTYISRGIGGSRFFTRLFNNPQMSYITITF